jgi:hypothetical protein
MLTMFLEPSNIVQAIGGMLPPPAIPPPAIHMPASSHGGRGGHPVIQLPGSQPAVGPLTSHLAAPSPAAGYTPNHAVYALIRDKKQKQAYAESAKIVTVEVRLVHVVPGRTSKEIIGVRCVIVSSLLFLAYCHLSSEYFRCYI